MPLLTVKPSNVNDLDCLRKFHTLWVLKQWPKAVSVAPVMRFSNGIHRVFQLLYDPNAGTPPHTHKLDAYLRAAFLPLHYADETDRVHDMARARRLVCHYLIEDEDDAASTIGVEKQWTFPVQRNGLPLFSLTARLDRMLIRTNPEQSGYDPETLTCRDYKLGRTPLTDVQIWINLRVARELYPRKRFPHLRRLTLEIDSLSEEGVERRVHHSRNLKGLGDMVTERVLRYLHATEYPAEPGPACAYCPLKASCVSRIEAVDVAALEFVE